VQKARDIQTARFKNSPISANSEMSLKQIKEFCPLPLEAEELIRQAMQCLHLSARSYHRVIKIARTIADLAGVEKIHQDHVAEALQYRRKEEEV
jgi:magnesium chelatase family protein